MAQVHGNHHAGARRQLPGHRPGHPVPHGSAAAQGRHRRRGLSRADPDRQADGLWLQPGAQAGGDRRARRGGRARSSTFATSSSRRRTRGSPGRSWKTRSRVRSRSSRRRDRAHELRTVGARAPGREPGRRAADRAGARHPGLAARRLRRALRAGADAARPVSPGGLPADADADPRVLRAPRAKERRGDRGQAVRACRPARERPRSAFDPS